MADDTLTSGTARCASAKTSCPKSVGHIFDGGFQRHLHGTLSLGSRCAQIFHFTPYVSKLRVDPFFVMHWAVFGIAPWRQVHALFFLVPKKVKTSIDKFIEGKSLTVGGKAMNELVIVNLTQEWLLNFTIMAVMWARCWFTENTWPICHG